MTNNVGLTFSVGDTLGITSMGVALLEGKSFMTMLRKEIYLQGLKGKKKNKIK